MNTNNVHIILMFRFISHHVGTYATKLGDNFISLIKLLRDEKYTIIALKNFN